jgi:hypothetical protein
LVSPSAANTIGLPVGGTGAVDAGLVAGVVAGLVAAATVSADAVAAVDPAVVAADTAVVAVDDVLASLPHAASDKLTNATYPTSAFTFPPLPAMSLTRLARHL